MPRTKSIAREGCASMESAWLDGGELAVTRQAVRKYAQVADLTTSGRDIKPLISGMFEAIDRLNALEAAEAASIDTPLANILAEAEAITANA